MKFVAVGALYVAGTLAVLVLALSSCRPNEELRVSGAWVPATVPGQTTGAAYMHLRSARDATLVKVDTDVAGAVEMHQVNTDSNNVVRMQPLEVMELPAGRLVTLTRGGRHFMLLDLKRPLRNGDTVNLTLTLRLGQGRYVQEQVVAKVGRTNKTQPNGSSFSDRDVGTS